MSGSPISRCTTRCPAASSCLAAARTTYACSVPSVSSRPAQCIDHPVGDNETPERAPGSAVRCNLRARASLCPTRSGGRTRAMLLGALQVHTLPGIDPHLLALGDEFRNLDGHSVRELRGLGARGLG